jgi:predicted deacylase
MTAWHRTRIALPGDRGFDRYRWDSGRPGLRVVVFGGVHGDETEGVIAGSRLAGMNLGLKSGSVDVIPIVHEAAYRNDTRTSPLDGGNLARVFPGSPTGTPTEQIAHALTTQVLPGADLLIDLHTSGQTYDIPFTVGYIDDGRDKKGLSARACGVFGADFIWRHTVRPPGRTLNGADAAIYTESPCAGPTDLDTAGRYVDGVLRVLHELGMLERPLAPVSTTTPLRIVSGGDVDRDLLPAGRDGLFVHKAKQGEKVAKGQLLGLIVDVKGATLEEIRAVTDGWVVVLKRRPHVRKGDPVVGVAAADA